MKKEVTFIGPEMSSDDYWLNVWRHRELAAFLAWRDLLVRYKQTFIGIAWTVLRPLASILVYTLVFGILAQLPSEGIPYTLIVLTGILPWQLFSIVLVVSSESLIANGHLVQKIYFPRILIPASSVVACIVDHLISFVLIFIMLVWFGIAPNWQIILLPLVTLMAVCVSLGLGLAASALNTYFRDLRQLIPIVLQVGVFVCPVGYVTSLLSPKWQMLYAVNPMVGVIDAFRWCILGRSDIIYPPSIAIAAIWAVVSLFVGVKVFRRMEAGFSDVM